MLQQSQSSKAQKSFLEVLPASLQTIVIQFSRRARRHEALPATTGNPIFRFLNVPTGFGIVRQQIELFRQSLVEQLMTVQLR